MRFKYVCKTTKYLNDSNILWSYLLVNYLKYIVIVTTTVHNILLSILHLKRTIPILFWRERKRKHITIKARLFQTRSSVSFSLFLYGPFWTMIMGLWPIAKSYLSVYYSLYYLYIIYYTPEWDIRLVRIENRTTNTFDKSVLISASSAEVCVVKTQTPWLFFLKSVSLVDFSKI